MLSSIFLLAALQQQTARQAPVPPVPAVLTVQTNPSPALAKLNPGSAPTAPMWALAHKWHLQHMAHLARLAALEAEQDAAEAAAKAAAQAPPPARAPVTEAAAVSAPVTVSPASYSGFQACVIARESGGNSQVWNPSGHWGLYQFSAGTWAAYGGNPADFGHAGVAEQNRVFANAMAAGGASNWAPYDGCTP